MAGSLPLLRETWIAFWAPAFGPGAIVGQVESEPMDGLCLSTK